MNHQHHAAPERTPDQPALRVRAPQHLKPTPLVYIEGTNPGGPGYLAASLFGSERVGDMYWMDLDGDAEIYTSGTGIRVIEPGAQWPDMIGQLRALYDVAALAVADTGQWPVLVINSITTSWRQCQRWAHLRARNSLEAQKIIKGDRRHNIPPNPNAVIETARNPYWEDAHARHRSMVKLLVDLPMIVIALGVSSLYSPDNPGPFGTTPEYRLNAHNDWPHKAQVWVRTSAEEGPRVMGVMDAAWHARHGFGQPLPEPDRDLSIESLIFDSYGLRMPEAQPEPPAPEEENQDATAPEPDALDAPTS